MPIEVPDTGPQAPAPPRGRSLLGGLLAVAVSAGLATWFMLADDGGLTVPANPISNQSAPPAKSTPPVPIRAFAPASVDRAQVQRAYDDFQASYAEAGADGLRRLGRSCREAVAVDPRILDDCLSLDIVSSAILPERATEDAAADRLALARGALPPGADLAGRIAAVGLMIRTLSVGASEPAAAPAKLRPVVSRGPVRPRAMRAGRGAGQHCRFGDSPADLMVCANPSLSRAHFQMRRAYDAALASGADRAIIDREQARWRAARETTRNPITMARLYQERTRALEDLSPPY